jgi:uncharacterized protein
MAPEEIIKRYYEEGSKLYNILVVHSASVAAKALEIARSHPELKLDEAFVREAAWLHDIGIYQTNAPEIYCFGKYPYICHGYLGADLLRKEGLERHARVCERHTGSGIARERIIRDRLSGILSSMRRVRARRAPRGDRIHGCNETENRP